jgi:hypothetical protein
MKSGCMENPSKKRLPMAERACPPYPTVARIERYSGNLLSKALANGGSPVYSAFTSFSVEHLYKTTLLKRGVYSGNQTTVLSLHQERSADAHSRKRYNTNPY